MAFSFTITKKIPNTLGRSGIITTAHGDVITPSFVPVATKASIKSLTPEQILETGAQVVLANTYHLFLQPGDEIVRDAGGFAKFMNWRDSNGNIAPTMTDSGGFQVFSLGAAFGKELSKVVKVTDPSLMIPERFDDVDAPRLAKIGNDGVSFKSHLDGTLHYITPEKSIEIQHNLGADIIFAFDECTSPTETREYQEEALERTHNWAKRCLEKHLQLRITNDELPIGNQKPYQALFGVVQGGRDEELRRKSARILADMELAPYGVEGSRSGFDGYGIGGSFNKTDLHSVVRWVNEELPEEKPRHLLGIGEPEDIFAGVENGVDLFDCVAPTRNARNGTLYTKKGKINILNTVFRTSSQPIEEGCTCYTCKNFSAAYVAHLFHGKEMLGGTLATIHNLTFMNTLFADIRKSIVDGNFIEFKNEFLGRYIN